MVTAPPEPTVTTDDITPAGAAAPLAIVAFVISTATVITPLASTSVVTAAPISGSLTATPLTTVPLSADVV